ncbi:hypothetical protein [Aerococcus kribbianus]|uniref:Uncharacterized protein n=1 Tax=Aerococcus kribbianus TaxID=2999064 RepID=A0A9X3FMH6_9LACT|nr:MULTISPECIES: hypothetical protein [unclassified Aerococcus]MCZ0717210.1 hypothetical protein [Aerococcus sp. YH-aer221]MCZ0725498.1 hypothetical protein [Aerococcus sp. YH-aer222]
MKKANILTLTLFVLYLLTTFIFKDQRLIPTLVFILTVASLPLGPKLFKEDRSKDSQGFLSRFKSDNQDKER